MPRVVSAELAWDAVPVSSSDYPPQCKIRVGFDALQPLQSALNSAKLPAGGWWPGGVMGPRHSPSTGRGLLHGVEDPGPGGDLLAGQCLSSHLGWSCGGASSKSAIPQKW